MISRIHLSLPNAYKLMCFDRNIYGNRDVKFLIGIIGHCTDERNLLQQPSSCLCTCGLSLLSPYFSKETISQTLMPHSREPPLLVVSMLKKTRQNGDGKPFDKITNSVGHASTGYNRTNYFLLVVCRLFPSLKWNNDLGYSPA